MLISHKWLEKYLPDLNRFAKEQIAEALTESLAEVEQIMPVRQEISNIFVAEVISVNKHENSDKLKLCQVTTDGENRIQVICGASNVREKAKVALCLPGGQVYTDNIGTVMTIEVAVIRGVESHGMLCSARELGISEDHSGILLLEDDIELGTDIANLAKDFVYEIENKSLSHRGDCFSHKGIAQELSAILDIPILIQEEAFDNFIPTTERKKLSIEVNLSSELCPRFSAVVIDNLNIAPSPLWMQCRLNSIGSRSINNVVDITNYIMFDIGQPLHAYDYNKLENTILTVRKAKSGEKAITLDGITRQLDREIMVVADGRKTEDIAGIMGGKGSQVDESTTTVVLEAANWEMYNIRRASRHLGLRTEASTRFEKGLDPNMTTSALKASLTLLSDLGKGELATELFDHYPQQSFKTTINIDFNQVNRALNLNLSKHEVISLLGRLKIVPIEDDPTSGSNPNQESQNIISFSIPTFRRDLAIKEDLIEEVARIYGFKNIVQKIPNRDITPAKSFPLGILMRAITKSFTDLGLDEVKTYSFIGANDYKKSNLDIYSCLEIANPITPDFSYFRNSLIPSLLGVAKQNTNNFNEFGIFEIGRTVNREKGAEELHKQPWTLGLLIKYDTQAKETFFKTKGYIEFLKEKLNFPLTFEQGILNPLYSSLFHPFQSATIKNNKEVIGTMGVIDRAVAYNYELPENTCVVEIYLDSLLENIGHNPDYSTLGDYPEMKRDISLWLRQEVTYADIIKKIKSLEISLLRDIHCKDIYRAEEGNSITLSLTFRSDEKTLTDEEIAKLMNFISNELTSSLNVIIRS